jgi:NADH dehydrogenase
MPQQQHRRIFVTGGSGFVGHAVIEELLRRDYDVNALVNRADLGESLSRAKVVRGGMFDAKALDDGMAGCDAVIHLVGIIMEKPGQGVTFEHIHVEGTRAVVDAAKHAGVSRFLHMSALGTRENSVSTYHKTKWKAEEYVRDSGLDFTILRPSMIHGPRGELMRMEAKWAKKRAAPFLFIPYFGAGVLGTGGAGKLQPVFVDDVARAFVDALENPKTINQTYDLAGPDVMTWPELHRTIARAVVGRPRLTMAIPAWYAKAITHVVPRTMLPFNHDQVVMSQQDNTAPIGKFVTDFGWSPRPFGHTLETYASELR